MIERDVRVAPDLALRVRIREGGGCPLLLLHGFTGGMDAWDSGALDEVGQIRTVIAVDLPGHGGSDPLRDPAAWTAGCLSELVVAVQRTLVGDGYCDWLGYSMGGRLALHAASSGAPIRRLLLESTSAGIEGRRARTARVEGDAEWIRRLAEDPLERFVDDWMSQPLFEGRQRISAGDRDRQRRVRMQADPASLAACLEGFGAGACPPAWEYLPDLGLPVHLMAGAEDVKYVALIDRMHDLLPDSTRTLVKGAGHAVHAEASDRWGSWVISRSRE